FLVDRDRLFLDLVERRREALLSLEGQAVIGLDGFERQIALATKLGANRLDTGFLRDDGRMLVEILALEIEKLGILLEAHFLQVTGRVGSLGLANLGLGIVDRVVGAQLVEDLFARG